MNIAFIPARSGSKRLVDKNFTKIGNRNLIETTIDVAKNSQVFDKILLSSDDNRAENIARENKIEYIRRAEKLSGDNTKVWEVVYNYLYNHNQVFGNKDFIVMLLPTSPFRKVENITTGLKIVKSEYSNVVSVSEYKAPIEFSISTDGNQKIDIEQNKFLSSSQTQTQTFRNSFYPNGNFFGAPISMYLKFKTFYANPFHVFKTNEIDSIDINSEDDLKFARKMYDMKNE
jgi:CMP-N-acetylneuraminic acid synthetase